MAAPTIQQLLQLGQDYGPLIGVLAVVGSVVTAVLFKYPAKVWAWMKRRGKGDGAGRRLPTETVRIVLEHRASYQGPDWSHATRTTDQMKGMQVYARWTFTNITRTPVKLVDAYLEIRPRVHGTVTVRKADSDIHGDYFLMPAIPVPGSTLFFVFPSIRRPGQDLKATVVVVDNLGNEHRARVSFRGPA